MADNLPGGSPIQDGPAQPTVILLGLPKAGTSSLHTCLARLNCCRRIKEANLFTHTRWSEPNATFQSLPPPHDWPMQKAGRADAALLDFTPTYLSRAYMTVPHMQQTYDDVSKLHIIVAMRDPVSRAFSEYCMFEPSDREVLAALRTRQACRLPIMGLKCNLPKNGACTTDVCLNDTGSMVTAGCWDSTRGRCTVSRGGHLSVEFEAARHSILEAFPWAEAAGPPAGKVNRTALAVQLFNGGRLRWANDSLLQRLTRLVLPHRDPACSRGWGWAHLRRNFTTIILDQIRSFRRPGCMRWPHEALEMSRDLLASYVRRCWAHLRPNSFLYAHESVPVFQLAWFLAQFPNARWTFVQSEALFGKWADPTAVSRRAHRDRLD